MVWTVWQLLNWTSSTFEEIKVCVAYEINGQRCEEFPSNARRFVSCRPIYKLPVATINGSLLP